jgi:3-methyladenine DNA glycosylase/8-oxoguanine DNA glycosylase/alkylated DNA nucleotide flippase Atl1
MPLPPRTPGGPPAERRQPTDADAAAGGARADLIVRRVREIPRGFVRTYSDIDPAAPRLVGRVLATSGEAMPWQRVVRADGSVPKGAAQLALLRRERVPLRGDRVDLAAARYPPGPPAAPPRRASLAAGIAAVAAADPAMAGLVEAAGPIRHRPRNPDGHLGALVRAIVFQQLAGAAANAIHGRLRALVPGALTPDALLRLTDAELRGAGLSGSKAASRRDLAAKVLDGTVALDGSRVPDEEVVARLVTVRGIGRWTAEMYLMFELRRLDVWPVDDLGVRHGYGLAFGIDPPPGARRLGPLGDRFRPYRSVAARYCWEAVAIARRTDTALR